MNDARARHWPALLVDESPARARGSRRFRAAWYDSGGGSVHLAGAVDTSAAAPLPLLHEARLRRPWPRVAAALAEAIIESSVGVELEAAADAGMLVVLARQAPGGHPLLLAWFRSAAATAAFVPTGSLALNSSERSLEDARDAIATAVASLHERCLHPRYLLGRDEHTGRLHAATLLTAGWRLPQPAIGHTWRFRPLADGLHLTIERTSDAELSRSAPAPDRDAVARGLRQLHDQPALADGQRAATPALRDATRAARRIADDGGRSLCVALEQAGLIAAADLVADALRIYHVTPDGLQTLDAPEVPGLEAPEVPALEAPAPRAQQPAAPTRRGPAATPAPPETTGRLAELVDEAMRRYDDEDDDAAADLLTEALLYDPAAFAAQPGALETLEELRPLVDAADDHDHAVHEAWSVAIRHVDDPVRFASHALRLARALQHTNSAAALEWLDLALDREPEHLPARQLRADIRSREADTRAEADLRILLGRLDATDYERTRWQRQLLALLPVASPERVALLHALHTSEPGDRATAQALVNALHAEGDTRRALRVAWAHARVVTELGDEGTPARIDELLRGAAPLSDAALEAISWAVRVTLDHDPGNHVMTGLSALIDARTGRRSGGDASATPATTADTADSGAASVAADAAAATGAVDGSSPADAPDATDAPHAADGAGAATAPGPTGARDSAGGPATGGLPDAPDVAARAGTGRAAPAAPAPAFVTGPISIAGATEVNRSGLTEQTVIERSVAQARLAEVDRELRVTRDAFDRRALLVERARLLIAPLDDPDAAVFALTGALILDERDLTVHGLLVRAQVARGRLPAARDSAAELLERLFAGATLAEAQEQDVLEALRLVWGPDLGGMAPRQAARLREHRPGWFDGTTAG